MQTKFDANLSTAIFYNGTAHSCFDIWQDFVECADPTGCGTGLASMAWDYQVYTCILSYVEDDIEKLLRFSF